MRLLITLLLSCFVFCATATTTLDEIQRRSAQAPVIRAEFAQTKRISGLNQPLKSSGNIIISQQQGLLWQQTQPFPLTLILTQQRMVQTVPGQETQIITADNNPHMFQFNALLISLFQTDRAELEKNFALTLQNEQGSRWILTLVPKTAPFDKLFHAITLTGTDFLETIEIDDRQNDKTSIHFLHHQTQPSYLTDEEQRRFAS